REYHPVSALLHQQTKSCRYATDADSSGGHHQKLVEAVVVRHQQLAQPGDLLRGGSPIPEPKVDDAGMGQVLPENQLTEVTVVGDEDAPFRHCNLQDLMVG